MPVEAAATMHRKRQNKLQRKQELLPKPLRKLPNKPSKKYKSK